MIDDDGIQEGGLVNLPVKVDEDLPGAAHQVKVFADQPVAVLAASVGAAALGAIGRGHQESPEQVLQALESLVDDGPGVLLSQRRAELANDHLQAEPVHRSGSCSPTCLRGGTCHFRHFVLLCLMGVSTFGFLHNFTNSLNHTQLFSLPLFCFYSRSHSV